MTLSPSLGCNVHKVIERIRLKRFILGKSVYGRHNGIPCLKKMRWQALYLFPRGSSRVNLDFLVWQDIKFQEWLFLHALYFSLGRGCKSNQDPSPAGLAVKHMIKSILAKFEILLWRTVWIFQVQRRKYRRWYIYARYSKW